LKQFHGIFKTEPKTPPKWRWAKMKSTLLGSSRSKVSTDGQRSSPHLKQYVETFFAWVSLICFHFYFVFFLVATRGALEHHEELFEGSFGS